MREEIDFCQFNIEQFQKNLDIYRYEYGRYISGLQEHKCRNYLDKIKVDYQDELINVKRFKSKFIQSRNIYIVVPSLFNSSDILNFSKDSSLIEFLTNKGDTYLLDWCEVDNQYKLDRYIDTVTRFIQWLKSVAGEQKIILLGHCIGGNIALCSALPIAHMIESIILLTTPWDFSHLKYKMQSALDSGVFDSARQLEIVPSLYIRTLFFLLFPEQFNYKLDKYFTVNNNKQLKLMKIEHWLHSGIPLSNSLFFQIIDEIVIGNKYIEEFANSQLLQKINCSILNVVTKKDRLVPRESTMAVVSQLPRAQTLMLAGGHISYLINGITGVKTRV